jgi:Family of unknown function (DUF6932)
MSLNFNSQGSLHETITLKYEELILHFGTNPKRFQQIANALQFFRIFHSCGCEVVFIDGSFVSKKKYPEDIDLCFEISNIDAGKLEREFPEFFDLNEMGRIHRDLHCHIFTFDKKHTRLFDMLSEDREGNAKGFVKLNLKDLPILL